MKCYLGIDFGTSGTRAYVIDQSHHILHESHEAFPSESHWITSPQRWKTALFHLIENIPLELRTKILSIAINGTSSTVLFCDQKGNPLDEALFYNDHRGKAVLEILHEIAPPHHTVLSPTSTLAKLLWWCQQKEHQSLKNSPIYLLHQADWLGFLLHRKLGWTDYHNALKLGYDIQNLNYPDWFTKKVPSFLHQIPLKLPQVVEPGTPIGKITPEISQEFSLPQGCLICAGTTDSIAAFFASGVKIAGEAVTSLGSTLAIKLLSQTYIENSHYGIYSHRFPRIFNLPTNSEHSLENPQTLWLVGGASNTGGAVLRQFFTDEELEQLSQTINPELETGLNYYPLIQKGERFPINDPNFPPKLEPYPANRQQFLQGILEGIAEIEKQGYQLLEQLGAPSLTKVYTAGGGAKNAIWTAIRERKLKVSVQPSPQTEAAYGTALLALYGITNYQP